MKTFLPTVAILLILAGGMGKDLFAGHFTPAWSGNPFNPMTIIVTQATLSGINLTTGDEIGIFDGVHCVGMVILTQSILPANSSTYAYITCSKDDPGTTVIDGFTEGHTIVYKIWKHSTGHETEFVTHTFPYSPSFVFEQFVQNETAVVALSAVNVPPSRVIQNSTVNNGETICYDATQLITVAGTSTIFNVMTGGNVTFVSGQVISFLPGTNVALGGYMRGYISTNGLYCGGQVPVAPLTVDPTNTKKQPSNSLVTLVPNPSRGTFKIVPDRLGGNMLFTLNVFSIAGMQVFNASGNLSENNEFHLEYLPAGVYFIRFSTGNTMESLKLVKL